LEKGEIVSVSVASPLAHLPDEADRILRAAVADRIALRVTGGVAVYLLCPSARTAPLARSYKDLDLVGRSGESKSISRLLTGLGYQPDIELNSFQGHQRLFFRDVVNNRDLDVFIGRMTLCHDLDLNDRLTTQENTISPADLLLSKLQVVQVNERDLVDTAALLFDHPVDSGGIDPLRIRAVLCSDWGWWRTATATLEKVVSYASNLHDIGPVVLARANEIVETVERAPKSIRWKARAAIGDRVRWYVLPEEVE
jgi:hypothetical protein